MNKIAIVSDTAADLTQEMIEKYKITLVNAFVHFGGDSYIVSDLTLDKFHEMLKNASKDNFPTTSQPQASEFVEVYEKLKEEGFSTILSVHVASDLSGTLNSANLAKGMIDNIDIRIIDSLGVTANLAATLIRTRELVEANNTVDDIVNQVEKFCRTLESFACLETMENLVRSGRISKTTGFIGKLLGIKPILRIGEGKLESYSKKRGIKQARQSAYEIATRNFSSDQKFKYIIAHTLIRETAMEFENKMKTDFPNATGELIEIGIVIATHAGPGAILILAYQ